VGDKTKVTITITGDSLHFYRDKGFWFETTITLPAGNDPEQLHATIKDCAEKGSIGEVVKAVYKIENGTLTLATIGDDAEGTADSFQNAGTRYELRKVKSEKKRLESPATGTPSDWLDIDQLLPTPSGSVDLTDPDAQLATNGGEQQGDLRSLVLEGKELYATLKLRQLDDSTRHLPAGVVLPEILTSRPTLSSSRPLLVVGRRAG
jgi:hypothetical protein